MLKIYCNLCDGEIENTGDASEKEKFTKIAVRNIKGIDVQIRLEIKVQKPNHICEECARKAIKPVLEK